MTASSVSGNTAGNVGGIYNLGIADLTNSTVSGNTANLNGGGIYNSSSTLLTIRLTITSSTISGNTATNGIGGGIYNNQATLTNTIIAGNSLGNDCVIDSFGTITSLGHNLDSDGTCGLNGPGDLSNVVDPKLGPLADNGGPTLTHALLPGSPAIDSGDDSVLGVPHNLTTDQRGPGFPRLQGAHVDIGAYEAAPAPTYTIELAQSWNLISLPIEGIGTRPVADVVASLGSNLTRIYCYDAANSAAPWGVYDPAALPFTQTLARILPDQGCWFLMSTGDTLVLEGNLLPVDHTSWSIVAGWQLVGWGAETMGDPAFIAGLLGGDVRIYGYNGAVPLNPWQVYDSAVPPFVNTLQGLVKWRGYWIYWEPIL